MSDANLITLKDIAEQLGINYRTMIDYKNHFREFIKLEYDGQGKKYPEKYTDFFRLILAMKEEGYSTSVAKMSLTGEIGLPSQEHLRDWIKEWQCGGKHPSVEGCIQPNEDEHIQPNVEGCTHPNVDGGEHPSEDGYIQPQEDDEIQAWMEEKIEAKVSDISERINCIEDSLGSDLTAQLNGAITQLYKAITELQLEYKGLHSRLAHLEKELGAAPAPNPVLIELDLESMQVKLEKPEPVDERQL